MTITYRKMNEINARAHILVAFAMTARLSFKEESLHKYQPSLSSSKEGLIPFKKDFLYIYSLEYLKTVYQIIRSKKELSESQEELILKSIRKMGEMAASSLYDCWRLNDKLKEQLKLALREKSDNLHDAKYAMLVIREVLKGIYERLAKNPSKLSRTQPIKDPNGKNYEIELNSIAYNKLARAFKAEKGFLLTKVFPKEEGFENIFDFKDVPSEKLISHNGYVELKSYPRKWKKTLRTEPENLENFLISMFSDALKSDWDVLKQQLENCKKELSDEFSCQSSLNNLEIQPETQLEKSYLLPKGLKVSSFEETLGSQCFIRFLVEAKSEAYSGFKVDPDFARDFKGPVWLTKDLQIEQRVNSLECLLPEIMKAAERLVEFENQKSIIEKQYLIWVKEQKEIKKLEETVAELKNKVSDLLEKGVSSKKLVQLNDLLSKI